MLLQTASKTNTSLKPGDSVQRGMSLAEQSVRGCAAEADLEPIQG